LPTDWFFNLDAAPNLHIPHSPAQCDNQTSSMRALSTLLLIPTFLLAGCGYHAVGSATHLPANVRTISVPVFATRAQQFHTEFAFTQAVIKELDARTKYVVLNPSASDPTADADATLHGTILSEIASPLTYDSESGQTSSYLITITARVVLNARDGHVLYQNNSLLFREQYQSTQDVSSFIQEDGPAIQRIAHDFAQTIVANLLESF
jgi:outer membrane lipopolysaccharide assembly protein LptE/RlpB